MKEPVFMKKLQDPALLLLRLIVATIFILSAFGKWGYLQMGAPGASANMITLLWFLIIVEPLGALGLIIGFLTRWAATGLAIIMVGAIFELHFFMGFSFFTQPQALGWDYNLLILGACIILMAFSGGKWSLDAR